MLSSNATNPSLTLAHAKNYIHMLDGNSTRRSVPTSESAFTKGEYRCHFVTVDEYSAVEDGFQYQEVYSRDNMVIYSKWVSCRCKAFYTTGWICLHAILVYARLGFNLAACAANLATNRRPGHPKKSMCTY